MGILEIISNKTEIKEDKVKEIFSEYFVNNGLIFLHPQTPIEYNSCFPKINCSQETKFKTKFATRRVYNILKHASKKPRNASDILEKLNNISNEDVNFDVISFEKNLKLMEFAIYDKKIAERLYKLGFRFDKFVDRFQGHRLLSNVIPYLDKDYKKIHSDGCYYPHRHLYYQVHPDVLETLVIYGLAEYDIGSSRARSLIVRSGYRKLEYLFKKGIIGISKDDLECLKINKKDVEYFNVPNLLKLIELSEKQIENLLGSSNVETELIYEEEKQAEKEVEEVFNKVLEDVGIEI